MKQSKRDRQWSRIRWVEFAYAAALFVVVTGLFSYAALRPVSDVVFWVVSSVTMLLGVGIWVRQYQVLDELGKLRFLKSWMVSGVVTSSGLAWTLWWALYQSMKISGRTQTPGLPDLPPDLLYLSLSASYLSLVAGLLAMGLTNLYLRRRDERGE
ncbi:hypothetical protein GCM10010840_33730 [Deinococcus aerolatus]|uniref:Uncharacterized protein n=1 Tax=Deinococcus aerolatus TaxID=522487 RepID=A0ABQ2GET2_9DEIO|nr:hypothetical protein [Deinococcus aerolatus]GGL92883.1 hypothetical protein GCM10010840_33730 [Deinococcus aerolatus]